MSHFVGVANLPIAGISSPGVRRKFPETEAAANTALRKIRRSECGESVDQAIVFVSGFPGHQPYPLISFPLFS